MGAVLMIVCSIGWIATALAVARRLAADAPARFWIFTLLLAAQLGFLGGVLSIFHALTPIGWTVGQVMLALFAVGACRRTCAPDENKSREPWTRLSVFLLGLTVLFVGITLLEQASIQINDMDDCGYHCSRVIYWIRHQHLFPWESHNIRQAVFPFGGELFFFWPVLLTRSELAGRLVVALADPLIVAGVYFTLKQLQQSRTAALTAALVMAITPAVYRITLSARPDLWVAVFTLGFTFWAIRSWQERSLLALVMLGATFVFAVNVKTTALALLLPLLVVMAFRRKVVPVMGGALAALVLSGLWVTWGHNLQVYGRLLGPESFTSLHQPTYSPRQVWTHAERTVFELFEFPIVPESVRGNLESAEKSIIKSIGADRELAKENVGSIWPGPYFFRVVSPGAKYSLPGLIWIPALVVGIVMLRRRDSAAMLVLIAIVSFIAVVMCVRWMPFGSDRFWLQAFAPALVLETVIVGRPKLRMFVIVGVGWMLLAAIVAHVHCAKFIADGGYGEQLADRPYNNVLPKIPDDAHVLAMISQNNVDYPLFGPRSGYSRQVVPWGISPFDQGRLRTMIRENHITHIVIEAWPQLDFLWFPAAQTKPFFDYFRTSGDFKEVPADGPIRLFEVKANLQ